MSEKVKLTLVSCILTLGLIITYSNHFDNAFHFDDSHTIVDNIFIRDIKNIPLFFQDAKTTSSLPTNQAYRPVITSLNTIDYWIAKKLDPFYFHLHIFIEYILLCLLLYFTFLKVFERASGKKLKWLSLFGATFFAFHTANAETINYIIARSDEFSTLMTIAGLLIFISSDGWKKQLGLIPFFIGCLAKPTTLMLAPILVVYDLLFEHPSILIKAEKARFVKRVSSSILITLPYFISGFILYFFTRSMFSDTWVPSNVKMVHYLNTQPYVFWIYLKTFFLPIDLTADTDLHLIKDFFDSRVLFGLIVIVAMLFVAIKTSFKRKLLPISFGILWFFVALIPSSSVVPLAEVMNHHRTFFPYIGLIISSTWVLYLLFEYFKKRAVSELRLKYIFMLCSVLFIATHAFGTYQRNIVWDSDESLWLDVTIRSPKNGRGQMHESL